MLPAVLTFFFLANYPGQALRVVMVVGVLECGFLLFNNIQDRFEGQEAREKRPAVT